MKHKHPYYCVFQVLNVLIIKMYKIQQAVLLPVVASVVVTLAFASADIIFHKFLNFIQYYLKK